MNGWALLGIWALWQVIQIGMTALAVWTAMWLLGLYS